MLYQLVGDLEKKNDDINNNNINKINLILKCDYSYILICITLNLRYEEQLFYFILWRKFSTISNCYK